MPFADAAIYIGRFHPLLVHLPIGFLLLAVILALTATKEKYAAIRPAISISLLFGAVSAVFACITGYLLSFAGDYEQDTLTVHMWSGIITALIAIIAYLLSIRFSVFRILKSGRPLMIALIAMVLMLGITGHFGGTLTHGPGYISTDLLFEKIAASHAVTDVNEAVIYADIVQPILEKKCVNCHNSSKKKGQLSMQDFQTLMKGGKHGTVIEAGSANKSELVKRVNLNPKDEKYMPADGKPSLTEDEKNIIAWWIDTAGASATKKIKDARPSLAVRNEINAYLGLQVNENEEAVPPDTSAVNITQVPELNPQYLVALKRAGFIIKFLNLKPLFLDITLPADKSAIVDSTDRKLRELLTVKDNIGWLNLAGNNLADNQLELISRFKNLQRLRLDNNPVTDAGVSRLRVLANLESLNLYNTKITNRTIENLSSLSKLKRLYVWGTGVRQDSANTPVKVIF